MLYVDVVGPLDKTVDGNVYILSVIDAMSNFIWLFPMQDQLAKTIAERLLTVFSYVGCAEKLCTDMGQNLVSKIM